MLKQIVYRNRNRVLYTLHTKIDGTMSFQVLEKNKVVLKFSKSLNGPLNVGYPFLPLNCHRV